MTYDDDLSIAGEPSGQFQRVGRERRNVGEPQGAESDDPYGEPPRPPRSGHNPPQTEPLLRRAADLIASARPMPLSSSVMINKDEVLELVDEAIAQLPEELRAARWLLKEREEFLAKVRREGDEILEAGRAKAERMVQRTEVVKSAEHRARHIIDAAEAEARRVRHECEDFCDQKLASFEIVLDRTLKLVAAGREKLAGAPIAAPQSPEEEVDEEGGFFNQDDQA
jgi:cell division septum initiation protein DivIVA